MALCTEMSVVNGNRNEGEISALRCKRWTCEVCHPYNRKKVLMAARLGRPNKMITLSIDPSKYETPDDAARDMKRALVHFRRHIERKMGVKNLPFLCVYERHKSGWPHMHILVRSKYLHRDTLIGIWKRLTGAWTVDIRDISKVSQIYYYVTKYIGKELAAFAGCKRWWRSHNYKVVDEDPFEPVIYGSGFIRVQVNYERVQQLLSQWRYDVDILGPHKLRYLAHDETHRAHGKLFDWESVK